MEKIRLILFSDESYDRIIQLVRTDEKFSHLNFTHGEISQPYGSNRGNLVSMFFNNTQQEVQQFISEYNVIGQIDQFIK